MTKLSVLDQSPVSDGFTPADALRNTIELARLADKLGYERYWIAEHHAIVTLASPAPEILIARIGAETSNIRIGSGGVLLPHYSSLKVAECFRMLHAMYPDESISASAERLEEAASKRSPCGATAASASRTTILKSSCLNSSRFFITNSPQSILSPASRFRRTCPVRPKSGCSGRVREFSRRREIWPAIRVRAFHFLRGNLSVVGKLSLEFPRQNA